MATITKQDVQQQVTEAQYEVWKRWPVDWSAVLVGALAAVAIVLIVGLSGLAIGMHVAGRDDQVSDVKDIEVGALALSVFGAFLAFVVGGWIAGKIAGILYAEQAMLHGAITWLVAVPMLVILGALGSSSIKGGWYAGLMASPTRVEPGEQANEAAATANRMRPTDAAEVSRRDVEGLPVDDVAARATRNSALGAVTALLLGLMGGVIGGWMASGEPMSFTHRRANLGSERNSSSR